MSAANAFNARLRHTEMSDLSLSDEVLHGAGHIFNRHIRVHAMLIEQINPVSLEALQRAVSDSPDPFRRAIQTFGRNSVLEAEFRRDDDFVANRCQRLADEFFVRKRTVCFGRIEQGHAAVKCCTDYLDSLIPFERRAVAKAQPHASESKR